MEGTNGQTAAAPQTPVAGAPAAATPDTPAMPAPAPGTPEAARQAADAANAAAQQSAPWYENLPEASHEKLKAFATPDEAVAAIEAGSRYTTAKSVEDYKFTFADPNMDQNAPPIVDFKKFCLEKGLAPEQAQGLMDYQTNLVNQVNKDARENGEATLRAEWGNNFDGNLTKSLTALTAIDRDTGGSLAAKLKQIGGANDPEVLKALLWVSERIGEDNLGAGGPGGAPTDAPISTEDAYAQLFGRK